MIKISDKDIELHTKDYELRMWKKKKILRVHTGWMTSGEYVKLLTTLGSKSEWSWSTTKIKHSLSKISLSLPISMVLLTVKLVIIFFLLFSSILIYSYVWGFH